MSAYHQATAQLKSAPKKWLVTGSAGFIGSHLLEALLKLDQSVVGLDNLSTGLESNLQEVRDAVSPEQWDRFQFVEGDISDLAVCRQAVRGSDFVLHQAAVGSVPRSFSEPILTHQSNVTGFLQMLIAGREAKVKRFIFASSSAVYGDNPDLPKVEDKIGKPLSPYAATKAMNELYAFAFANGYGFNSIGLRYFNVFGQRQNPKGAYAAVIPQWIRAFLTGKPVYINGDGETSRDFCFVGDVVQANLLAAVAPQNDCGTQIYNVASGQRTTLNELFGRIQEALRRRQPGFEPKTPLYRDFRPGDVRHSQADISKAQESIGYRVSRPIEQTLESAMDWYVSKLRITA